MPNLSKTIPTSEQLEEEEENIKVVPIVKPDNFQQTKKNITTDTNAKKQDSKITTKIPFLSKIKKVNVSKQGKSAPPEEKGWVKYVSSLRDEGKIRQKDWSSLINTFSSLRYLDTRTDKEETANKLMRQINEIDPEEGVSRLKQELKNIFTDKNAYQNIIQTADASLRDASEEGFTERKSF